MRPLFEYVVEVVASFGSGQDRARVFERDEGILIALADGAGGTGNGAVAADAIIDAVGSAVTETDWSTLLVDLDGDAKRLRGGQSTAVIISITDAGLAGASVGDSGASLITGSDVADLTAGQRRSRWSATVAAHAMCRSIRWMTPRCWWRPMACLGTPAGWRELRRDEPDRVFGDGALVSVRPKNRDHRSARLLMVIKQQDSARHHHPPYDPDTATRT